MTATIADGFYIDFYVSLGIWILMLYFVVCQYVYSLNTKEALIQTYRHSYTLKYNLKATICRIFAIIATYPDYIVFIDTRKITQGCIDLLWMWFIIWAVAGSFDNVVQNEFFQVLRSSTLNSFSKLQAEFFQFHQHITILGYVCCFMFGSAMILNMIFRMNFVQLWRQIGVLVFAFTSLHARKQIGTFQKKLQESYKHFKQNRKKLEKSKKNKLYIKRVLAEWSAHISKMNRIKQGTLMLAMISFCAIVIDIIAISHEMQANQNFLQETAPVVNYMMFERYSPRLSPYINALSGVICVVSVIHINWNGFGLLCGRKCVSSHEPPLEVEQEQRNDQFDSPSPLPLVARKLYSDLQVKQYSKTKMSNQESSMGTATAAAEALDQLAPLELKI